MRPLPLDIPLRVVEVAGQQHGNLLVGTKLAGLELRSRGPLFNDRVAVLRLQARYLGELVEFARRDIPASCLVWDCSGYCTQTYLVNVHAERHRLHLDEHPHAEGIGVDFVAKNTITVNNIQPGSTFGSGVTLVCFHNCVHEERDERCVRILVRVLQDLTHQQ